MRGRNTVSLHMICADINGLLDNLNHAGVTLFQLTIEDELNFRAEAEQAHVDLIREITEKRGGVVKILQDSWGSRLIRALQARIVMLTGILLLLCATVFLQGRILVIRVSGNCEIPTAYIVEALEMSGVRFGAATRFVRSEKVKNELMEQIPELKWVGVNVGGSVVTVSVKEKSLQNKVESNPEPANMVATCDGVILDMTTTAGTACCSVGQVVRKGQVLISAYTECGKVLLMTRAKGEVIAQTKHVISAISPTDFVTRGAEREKSVHYSLKIGKKLINFCKDGGISDGRCVKIYDEIEWTLPGGHFLPVTLVKETRIYYDDVESVFCCDADHGWLIQAAKDYQGSTMIAGQILEENCKVECAQHICHVQATFTCREMIGRIHTEQILQ